MTQDDDEFERKFAPRTLPEQVAEELGAEIIAGRRKSGERLIELELAQSFHVSRGSGFSNAGAWSTSTLGAAPMCGRCR
jgi:DNA-binding GntR family transcriptional regulator